MYCSQLVCGCADGGVVNIYGDAAAAEREV